MNAAAYNPYQPTSMANYAEKSSEATNLIPDDRFGAFVLVLSK
jgi:hypothetical protein